MKMDDISNRTTCRLWDCITKEERALIVAAAPVDWRPLDGPEIHVREYKPQLEDLDEIGKIIRLPSDQKRYDG